MDQLQPGCTVKILEGAFAGFEGTVQAVSGIHITVMVKLFERETSVQFRLEQLEWEELDLRPTFRQDLTNQLESERTKKLNDWWLQHLDQSEDDLAGEYRAFLQFRTRVDVEHVRRSAQLHHDFSSLFTDRLLDEEGNAKLKARWSEWLERERLKQRGYGEPLTTFELHCLKRLDLIDDKVDLQASMRQRWQETLASLKTQYTDATSEEWAAIEEGWWEDFERGAISAERKVLLAIWGIRNPSKLPSPHHYRSLLWQAAEERHHQAKYAHFRQEHLPPLEELAALRAGARQQAEAQREPVQAFFQQAYQLTLPDHVFAFWAFWLGLTPLERAAMDWRINERDEFDVTMSVLGISPGGIFEYFEKAGRERIPQAGLDHRLNDRFYRDPPEFFTALHGDTDGLHFGLWYDNPHEPSAFAASYYSRDGGGIAYKGQTLLEAVREEIEWTEFHSDDYSEQEEERSQHRLSIQLLRDAVMEYETGDRPERGEDYVDTYGNTEGRIPTCNELGVIVPPPHEQLLERDVEAIYHAIRTDDHQVKTWIDEALQACAQGQPARALALGHDLHWLSHDQQERKEAAHLLLIRAYEMLGYRALAEIATLHHQYRDLPNVDIYNFHYDFSS
ncbi:ADP-ribosylation family protein [Ktedonospora formicarum]|uniref:KOW domain-containing protein n=1 Tax=Ktedonospora formicarum TaxID=2778364 RepID=A0A8J3IAX5_9CHLR|nr:ADP-ribosylation family protein [Ktedonospora formicarum]GHO50656.1 hypothetical protein KSX_88190 [Ktedonospora formicarum]